jgi:hypothetical protein
MNRTRFNTIAPSSFTLLAALHTLGLQNLIAVRAAVSWNENPSSDISIMLSAELASPTRDWIERQFALFGKIIPASTADTTRRRTSYFYRQEAITWAQMARQDWPTPTFAELCARTAKSYLAEYRAAKHPGMSR